MYTVDVNSDEPIMLLNKQIGMTTNEDGSWDGEPYIDGAQFQEELLWLDTMNKKRIQVWCCGPGGNIIQAMNIFSAILKSKTPVDTYNTGICASAHGLVFMAGRKRVMADFAQFMMHPVAGGDEKSMNAFTESCKSMLSSKSNLSTELVGYMMNITTWLGSSECFEKGICTEIEVTKESNKKNMPTADVKAMMAFSNNILHESISNLKPITMSLLKITNKLKLVDGSNEETILSAINQLEADKTTAENNLNEAQNKVTDLTNQLETANQALQAEKAKAEAAEEATKETAAVEMVNSFKNRIGDKPEILTKWVNMAKADMAYTKELLESIPLNVVNNKIPTGGEAGASAGAVTAAGIMQEIRNNLEKKKG